MIENFAVGDTIEVTYRFKVRDVYLSGYFLSESGIGYSTTKSPDLRTIKVISKAEPKFAVGDVIRKPDFDRLPVDTVISDDVAVPRELFVVVEPGVLRSLYSGTRYSSSKFMHPRKIISLPDSYTRDN